MTAQPRIVGDRLYGISMRPQELAMYGERVRFTLRYSPIFEDPEEVTERHFNLLVLEVHAEVPPEDGLAGGKARTLQLLKCGWELELEVQPAARVGTLGELPGEVPRLLDRVADTVNELARRAGLEAPMGPELITTLLHQYRTAPVEGAGEG